MRIGNSQPPSNQSPSNWERLLNLYEDIKKLAEDMKNNPSHRLEDLDKMIKDANEMQRLAHNTVSAPNFKKMIGDLIGTLNKMKQEASEGLAQNPNQKGLEQELSKEMAAIFQAIAQG